MDLSAMRSDRLREELAAVRAELNAVTADRELLAGRVETLLGDLSETKTALAIEQDCSARLASGFVKMTGTLAGVRQELATFQRLRDDRFAWTDPSQIVITKVSPVWLDLVEAGDRPLAGLPPLGKDTCQHAHPEDGYWCSLPKDHGDRKHVAQGDTRVVATWEADGPGEPEHQAAPRSPFPLEHPHRGPVWRSAGADLEVCTVCGTTRTTA